MSWDEYKVKFLASKGHSERGLAEKMRNNEELKVDEESECTGRWGQQGRARWLVCCAAEVGVAGVASQTEPLGSSSPMPPHSGRWVGRSSQCPPVGSSLGGGGRRCQELWAWRTAKPSGSVGLVGHPAGG